MAGNVGEFYQEFLIKQCIKLKDLLKLCSNADHVRSYMFKEGLLADRSGKCPKCKEGNVNLRVDNSESDGYVWRCGRTKKCTYKVSIRKDSFFENSNLKDSLGTILQIIYHWCWSMPQDQLRHELDIAEHTSVDWYNFCREICEQILILDDQPIGGEGCTVEIDESKYGKRKHHRGRRVDGAWVLGGICRETNHCFMVIVEDRSAATMVPIINKFVANKTTINTDGWASYRGLSDQGKEYFHRVVNHSIEFVCTEEGPNFGCHTNKIESTWRASKRDLPTSGTQKQLLQSYLWTYCVKKKYLTDKICKFKAFIQLIKRIYELNQHDPTTTPRKESFIFRGKVHQGTQTDISEYKTPEATSSKSVEEPKLKKSRKNLFNKLPPITPPPLFSSDSDGSDFEKSPYWK